MSLIFKYGRISLLSLIRRSKLFSFAPKVIRNILESCLKLTVIPEVTPVISHLPSMIAAAFLVFFRDSVPENWNRRRFYCGYKTRVMKMERKINVTLLPAFV